MGGFSVLSIPNVTAFTVESNVIVVNSTCDLRCAEPDVCDVIISNSTELNPTVLNPGDLEPNGDGIPFAIASTALFMNDFCTTGDCLTVECTMNQKFSWKDAEKNVLSLVDSRGY